MCAEPQRPQTAERLQEIRREGWTGVYRAGVGEETDQGWSEKGLACHAGPWGHSASDADGGGVKMPRSRGRQRLCAVPGGPGLASRRKGQ